MPGICAICKDPHDLTLMINWCKCDCVHLKCMMDHRNTAASFNNCPVCFKEVRFELTEPLNAVSKFYETVSFIAVFLCGVVSLFLLRNIGSGPAVIEYVDAVLACGYPESGLFQSNATSLDTAFNVLFELQASGAQEKQGVTANYAMAMIHLLLLCIGGAGGVVVSTVRTLIYGTIMIGLPAFALVGISYCPGVEPLGRTGVMGMLMFSIIRGKLGHIGSMYLLLSKFYRAIPAVLAAFLTKEMDRLKAPLLKSRDSVIMFRRDAGGSTGAYWGPITTSRDVQKNKKQ